jgi:2-amino-4-hydroxy-6-hydroxymethyldihydropteridine diphosphokinase
LEPRTVDLDIILFGEQISQQTPELPRSDIFKYAFVLQPLLELCPQLVVPNDGRTIEQIAQQFQFELPLSPVSKWFS